jgi:hypothetical protein
LFIAITLNPKTLFFERPIHKNCLGAYPTTKILPKAIVKTMKIREAIAPRVRIKKSCDRKAAPQ